MVKPHHDPDYDPPRPWWSFHRRRMIVIVGAMMVLAVPLLVRWVNTQAKPPAAPITSISTAVAQTPAEDESHTLTIPLTDGRVDMTKVKSRVSDWLGLSKSADKPADANAPAAAPVWLEQLQSATHGILHVQNTGDNLTLKFDEKQFWRQDKQVRTDFRHKMEQLFPESAAEAKAQYGLFIYAGNDSPPVRLDHVAAALPAHVVVLIHGLDDPGEVWSVLRPTLLARHETVGQFEYPNDQPIDESAALLAEQLKLLRAGGVTRIDMVAHSMGGLVARQVLTDARWYAGDGASQADLPDIARLIMVGTPQHGSELARFRFAAEWRDQFARAIAGQATPLGGIFDGAGEAEVDLLPGSDFLTALNARPLPAHTKLTIIAGRASGISDEKLVELREHLSVHPPEGDVDAVRRALDSLADNIGDGAVTLESSRLDGVTDYTIVDGNHLSIIRNVLPGSERIPPALPIVLDRLEKN
ncbi:MAG: hypothetical protein GC162_01675 [Planctomycetes bacterium]|nr:hypothetical protein [Planctomycetota bacterium]